MSSTVVYPDDKFIYHGNFIIILHADGSFTVKVKS